MIENLLERSSKYGNNELEHVWIYIVGEYFEEFSSKVLYNYFDII